MGKLSYDEKELRYSAMNCLVASSLKVNHCSCVITWLYMDRLLFIDNAGAFTIVGQDLLRSIDTLRWYCTVLVDPLYSSSSLHGTFTISGSHTKFELFYSPPNA